MSQQRDFESMAWRVIGRLESGQTQRGVADAQKCFKAVEYKKQENVDQGQNRECYAAAKTVCGNRTNPAKQYVIGFMREGVYYMVCIPLTPRPGAARRRWAAEHRDWEQHDWSQVLFTDESLFSLECDTRCVLVWRDRGE
ncbi:hypothetical protein TNCV_731041 [Trichonephila clavipes]|nr:hypothetical protein TNCV_731041 [Trichonephila clavipes]